MSSCKDLEARGAGRSLHVRVVGVGSVSCVWAVVALMLGLLPGRAGIAPRIQSDYCYQLLAADRLYDGQGFTSLQPVAPFQPWQWQYDWGYLTQWPPGFALLIAGLRWIFCVSTVTACQLLAVLSCATALIGWYLWLKRIVPSGGAGVLLAATAAGCALPIHYLVDPSSDAVLAAVLPFVLLLTDGRTTSFHSSVLQDATAATGRGRYILQQAANHFGKERYQPSTLRWCVVGLLAGALIWLRYAAVFLAPAIGFYLLIQWRLGRGIRLRHFAWFAASAAFPIAALVATNRVLGAGPAQQQFNVGHTVGMNLTPQLLWSAWENFANLGFYDYHRVSRWIWALWPVALTVGSLSVRPWRRAVLSFIVRPAVCLSACVLFGCLAFLIAATSLFGDKFDYAGLTRYYDPIRPIYFALFAAPLLMIRHRAVRVAVGLACFAACNWILQQEWRRPYLKLTQARQAATPYGQAEEAFPDWSRQLYSWLAGQEAPELIVISNFHEYVSLETRIPAFPIPEDVDTLNRWIKDIRRARGVDEVRVLFVLDPDNRWRSYWQPDPAQTTRRFDLRACATAPDAIADLVFEYLPRRESPRLGNGQV